MVDLEPGTACFLARALRLMADDAEAVGAVQRDTSLYVDAAVGLDLGAIDPSPVLAACRELATAHAAHA